MHDAFLRELINRIKDMISNDMKSAAKGRQLYMILLNHDINIEKQGFNT